MTAGGEICWVCDQCGKSFHSRLSRTLHRRTHSVYRPYTCTHKVCNQTFSELSQLQRHRRAHMDYRKYRCRICKTTFLYPHHLKLHRCRIKDAKIHNCHICSSKFLQILALAHHLKTKHSKLIDKKKKWVGKAKKLKRKKNQRSKANEKDLCGSGKEKILLKIALGKSMTIISPNKTPSHLDKIRRSKRKSNKKDKLHRKKSQKNGIILSFKNGSVSSVPLDSENMRNDNASKKLKPLKINGLLKKVIDEPKIPKLRIKACPQMEVSRNESTEDEDVPELYSRTDNSILDITNLRKLNTTDNNIDNYEELTSISKLSENTIAKFPQDTKVRSGIIIHKNKGRYSSSEQLQTTKSRKFDSIDSPSVGLWEVMPSPHTDSSSDFLKLRLSPKKPLKLDSGLDNTFECANSRYLDVSFKAKSVDSCAEDSDMFETSPCADKDLVEVNSVNDSGIEVLSSSSCNRSNGNSVRSVILDENSPTYCLAEDSLISLDSPIVEAASKSEHSICMKCGGIIMETNNNTRSPSKCQCSFISSYLTSPYKNMTVLLDDGYTEMEADNTCKEESHSGPNETYLSRISLPASMKVGSKMNNEFSPASACNITPVEVTKVETSETSPLKMKFRFEREPCVDIQKSETIICAVTEEKKTTDERLTIHKRKPLFRSDSKTSIGKQLEMEKTDSASESSTSANVEMAASTKKPLFKSLKKKEQENICADGTGFEMENNNEISEVLVPSNETVIIVDDDSCDELNCVSLTSSKCSGSMSPSTKRKNKRKVKHSGKFEKDKANGNNKREHAEPDINSQVPAQNVRDCKLPCTTDSATDTVSVDCKAVYSQGKAPANEETVSDVAVKDALVGESIGSNSEDTYTFPEVSSVSLLESASMPILKSPVKSPLQSPFASPAMSPAQSQLKSPGESPLMLPLEVYSVSLVQSPAKSLLKSPVRSPSKSPARSSSESPVKSSSKSPVKSPVKSPSKSPMKSPVKSPSNLSVKSPVKSSVKSPSKSAFKSASIPSLHLHCESPAISPSKSKLKSPVEAHAVSLSKSPQTSPSKSPQKSPQKSPLKSPFESPPVSPRTSPLKLPLEWQEKSASNSLTKSPLKSMSPVKSLSMSKSKTPAEPSSKSPLKSSVKSPSKSPTCELPKSPAKLLPKLFSNSLAKSPSGDTQVKTRENIFSTIANDFEHSTSVSPGKSIDSLFHSTNIPVTERPLKSDNEINMCKMLDSSAAPEIAGTFESMFPETNTETHTVENPVSNQEIAENTTMSVENDSNVSEIASTHDELVKCHTASRDEDVSQPIDSILASQLADNVNPLYINEFEEDSLQLIPQSPKPPELRTVGSAFDESEKDSLQQLPAVVDNLPPKTTPKTSRTATKKTKSPLDLFQQQFLSFLSNKEQTGETKGNSSKCKAASSELGKSNIEHIKNQKKLPAKRNSINKSNDSNKIKHMEKSEEASADKANDPMFDDDIESELGATDQNTENSASTFDWLKCTFDSDIDSAKERRKGSQSPELDLTIIVYPGDVTAKKLNRVNSNSSDSKLKLKKKNERSKFGELQANSNLTAVCKNKHMGNKVSDICKKQSRVINSDTNENSLSNDTVICDRSGKKSSHQKAKNSDSITDIDIKLSRDKTIRIETDSESSNSSSIVDHNHKVKHCAWQGADATSDIAQCSRVKDNESAGIYQNTDSDPDYNPFDDLGDDFQIKQKLGPHQACNSKLKKRRNTFDNIEKFTGDEDSLPYESQSFRKTSESDRDTDMQNRGRRSMQGRKSCCPCCLGTSLPNKREEHGGHTHPRHMYKLPKNYKQFIKSTTKLLALQERVHNLFISLFPDCNNLVSKSQIGTENFESLIDEVISGLNTNEVEFEPASTNILLSNHVTAVQSNYTEAQQLSFVTVENDLKAEQQSNTEDHYSEISKTVQYLVDEVVMNCDSNSVEMPPSAGNSQSHVGMSSCKSCPYSGTINNCLETGVESHTTAPVKHKHLCENIASHSAALESNNKVPEDLSPTSGILEKGIDSDKWDATPIHMPDRYIPDDNSLCRSESDCPMEPIAIGNHLQPLIDASELNNVILMETCNYGTEMPLDFELESEAASAIPPVQNELVITIDLNAARVSLCKDPNDCLRRLHSKIVKLVMSLLPDLKLKNSLLKNQDNLEFLLDLISKSNAGPIPDDSEIDLEQTAEETVAQYSNDYIEMAAMDSVCVEMIRTEKSMNNGTSDKIEKPDKCGDLITNFLAKCEKIEAEKSECSAKNEMKSECSAKNEMKTECSAENEMKTECSAKNEMKTECSAGNEMKANSENIVEERMPLFSKCQEMFENDIKWRKESLKKDIFEFEQDHDAVLADPKGADHVLRSFRRLTRKKKVDIAKKYRKIAKREDKKKKSKRLTTSPNVENDSVLLISDNLAHTKKRFLSELSLGDKNGHSAMTASIEGATSASSSSKEPSPVKVAESAELPSPDSKRHADKNIFELLQPSHMEPSSSL